MRPVNTVRCVGNEVEALVVRRALGTRGASEVDVVRNAHCTSRLRRVLVVQVRRAPESGGQLNDTVRRTNRRLFNDDIVEWVGGDARGCFKRANVGTGNNLVAFYPFSEGQGTSTADDRFALVLLRRL